MLSHYKLVATLFVYSLVFQVCYQMVFSNFFLPQDSTGDPSTRKVLLGRANELVNVLKIPSIASAVLSPTPHSSEAQEVKRRTNIAHLLQSTANHLQLQTS